MPVEITLREITVQLQNGDRHIPIFNTVVHAIEHLCDHVLSHEESREWTLLINGLRDLILSEKNRTSFARAIWDNNCDRGIYCDISGDSVEIQAQNLYNEYANEIRLSIGEAMANNWCVRVMVTRPDNRRTTNWYAMGLSGVHVVFNWFRVKTAMLPQPGRRHAGNIDYEEAAIIETRKRNPLPRHEKPASNDSICIKVSEPHQTLNRRYQMFRNNLIAFLTHVVGRYANYCGPNRATMNPGFINGETPNPDRQPFTFNEWKPLWQQRNTTGTAQ